MEFWARLVRRQRHLANEAMFPGAVVIVPGIPSAAEGVDLRAVLIAERVVGFLGVPVLVIHGRAVRPFEVALLLAVVETNPGVPVFALLLVHAFQEVVFFGGVYGRQVSSVSSKIIKIMIK